MILINKYTTIVGTPRKLTPSENGDEKKLKTCATSSIVPTIPSIDIIVGKCKQSCLTINNTYHHVSGNRNAPVYYDEDEIRKRADRRYALSVNLGGMDGRYGNYPRHLR